MVNAAPQVERRERGREQTADHGVLGTTKLNPFGDLHTMQHLSARLARSLRGLFESLLREELRCWAEPLVVQRFADYRAERGDGLSAWLPMAMTSPSGSTSDAQALIVIDGAFSLALIDLLFGGTGAVPDVCRPNSRRRRGDGEPAGRHDGRAPARRLGVARPDRFPRGHPEASPAMLSGIEGDDAMIVTRFGIDGRNAARR